jgi:lipoprotein-anchoring transpeptidase ErfK/SrfK
VKRLLAVGLFLAGFVAAGALAGAVIADTGTTTTTPTDSATTAVTTTSAATTTTTTTTTPLAVVPPNVHIGSVAVGGLTRADAAAAVEKAFHRPLPVVVDGAVLKLDPSAVASAYVATAVARARVASPGSNVDLVVSVRGPELRAWVAKVRDRFTHKAVDASLTLKAGKPHLTPSRAGQRLNAHTLYTQLVAELRANSRAPLRVHTLRTPPKTSGASFGPTILINRGLNRLYLFRNTGRTLQLWRTFAVATGQSIYPTPKGTFTIVVKWVNPTWYPPTQDAWAKGLKPVPPGPNNPLGTRWMGLSAPGVGIHGTDEPASIGYSASHGCIRMQVPDAEWLFDRVRVGTIVFIV